MAFFFKQLRLLLWKNTKLRLRQPARLVTELVWPLLLFLILAWVKLDRGLKYPIHECHFDGKSMPSAGPLPFLQSLVCTANNTCHDHGRPDEEPGVLNTYNTSILSELFLDLETLLGDQTSSDALVRLVRDFGTLRELNDLSNAGSLSCAFELGTILIDPDELTERIQSQNITLSDDVVAEIGNLNVNTSEVFRLFQLSQSTFFPEGLGSNLTLTGITLQEELCPREGEEWLFTLPTAQRTEKFLGEVCSLSQEQFTLLLRDVLGQINQADFLQKLTDCAEELIGRGFEFLGNGTLENGVRLLSEFEDLGSVRGIISTFQSSFARISENFPELSLDNLGEMNLTTLLGNSSILLSELLCGHSGGIVQITENKGGMFSSGNAAEYLPEEGVSDEEKATYVYDNSTTAFCNDLFEQIESQQLTRIFWRQIKPMVRGKIPYAPDTPVVRRLIREANQTFVTLVQVKQLAEDWLKASPGISDFLSNSDQARNIRDFIDLYMMSNPGDAQIALVQRWLFNGPRDQSAYDWRDSIEYTDYVMTMIVQYMNCFEFDKFEPHKTEEDVVNTGLTYIGDNKLWAGLIFDIDSSENLPTHIKYKIRMDTDRVDSTSKSRVLDRFWTPGPRAKPLPDMKYVVYGFSYIQDMVEHAIIREHTGDSLDEDIGMTVQQFPYPCYINDKFTMAISRSLPLFMILSWIYAVSILVKAIVYEKEQRLKEVMKTMGLTNAVHWCAWFITAFVMMLLSVFLLLIVLKVGTVLEHSDGSVIFVFLLAFTIATIMQCFMISVFFQRANLAAACAGILYFIGHIPYTFCTQWEEYMRTWQKALASLLSSVSFGFGCSYIARYEEQGIGIQWSNIHQSVLQEDDFSMLACIFMMLVDALIYMIIAWYVEAVFPGQFGMPRPWYFFVTKSYWCGYEPGTDGMPNGRAGYEMDSGQQGQEDEPKHLPLGVSIQKLCKVYKSGQKVAVDGLNLNFYEGQITSFLGHNGAGKTTTMSILTGLFPPTEGTAVIYGQDIRTDINEIRKSLGMCPQHNVLFDHLTVEEHIWFYSSLKGMPEEDIRKEMNAMIMDIGLPHKRNEYSAKLSGGMKRKLSVAIAFTAGSKVVILDEPTAGVDPYARRSIWDLLLKYRAGRTIILSTHFMDEADILGDRIAIINQGKLCCVGSSLFLKSNFGGGYYLTLVKDERKGDSASTSDVKVENATEDGNAGEISTTAFIMERVPEAVLVESIGIEMTYQLPNDKSHTASFEKLFRDLDAHLSSLGLLSYGVSDTTLEEVFLKVANESEEANHLSEEDVRQGTERLTDGGMYARPVTRLSFRKRNFFASKDRESNELLDADGNPAVDADVEFCCPDSAVSTASISCNGTGSYKVTGLSLIPRQFLAIFIKRFNYLRRSKKAFISQIILPAVFVCISMIFSMINPPMPQEPAMEIHPWLMSPSKLQDSHLFTFFSNDLPSEAWTQAIEDLLTQKPGLGVRCMDPDVYSLKGFRCVDAEDSQWSNVEEDFDEPEECSCESGYQRCPKGAAGAEASKYLLPTTDEMYNMTGRNISDWILKTSQEYIKRRYGGLTFGERNDLLRANDTEVDSIFAQLATAAAGDDTNNVTLPGLILDLENLIKNIATKRNAKIWFNNKGYVSMVAYMNVMNNLVLRAHLPPDTDPSRYGISLINHPMNRTSSQLYAYTLKASIVDVMISVSVIFAMCLIPASFVLFLIEERVSGSKHLQFVSGVNPVVYWVANFTWDMLNYLVSGILCILIFVAFQQNAYVSQTNAPCLVSLLLLYGWAATPMMYPASHFFNVPSSAFVILGCMNIFLGIISTLSTFILEAFMEQELDEINAIIMKVFLVLPHYCLGRGLIDMTRNQLVADIFENLGETFFQSPFTWDIVGRNLLSLSILGVFFFFLNICIEYKFWIYSMKCISPCKEQIPVNVEETDEEDIDVVRERERVTLGAASGDILTLEGLTKVYKSPLKNKGHRAVDRLSVGVHSGECFGLLGVNGAGKTTTFKMLTGDIKSTDGDAHLAGHSIRSEMTAIHQNLGYCPQFDALCPLLTPREHLQMYARLRGVPAEDVDTVAEWGIEKLGLVNHAAKLSHQLSGGNKRKLSTAIALVGNPPVIFLDEPTTGMDPKARRFLWNCISGIIKDGRSVVLTSHSMEECEALCNRIVIMVNGQFKCIGSIQHLKNRFGDGYMITLKVTSSSDASQCQIQAVASNMESTFPGIVLKEQHHNMLQYQVPSSVHTSLADIFGHIERVREEMSIEDYSVSQTTLDQVFINFAKLQTDLLEDELKAAELMNNSNGQQSNGLKTHSNGWNNQSPEASAANDHALNVNTVEIALTENGVSKADGGEAIC